MAIKEEWDGTTTGSGARVKPTVNDVYNSVVQYDYSAVPRQATAGQGIGFLQAPRYQTLVLNDSLRATDLAFGIVGKLAPDQIRPYVAAVSEHPVMATLKSTSPKASAYYEAAFQEAVAENRQDPDRTAWQTARRAYLDAKKDMTDEQVEAAANILAQNEALARLGKRNPYSEVDAKLAVADTLPSGAAFDRFVAAHVKSTPALAALLADAPATANNMLAGLGTRRFAVESNASAKAKTAPAGGAPVPPSA